MLDDRDFVVGGAAGDAVGGDVVRCVEEHGGVAGVVVVLVLRVVDAREGDAVQDVAESHRPVRKKAVCGSQSTDFHPVLNWWQLRGVRSLQFGPRPARRRVRNDAFNCAKLCDVRTNKGAAVRIT